MPIQCIVKSIYTGNCGDFHIFVENQHYEKTFTPSRTRIDSYGCKRTVGCFNQWRI
jgi:hypothetical protein